MSTTAWYGEAKLKEAAMQRLRADVAADRLMRGTYWSKVWSDKGEYKGCHLGCLTRDARNSHDATSRMFGLEFPTPHLLEGLFESSLGEDGEWWVLNGTEAIPVGADLSLVPYQMFSWWLSKDSPLIEAFPELLKSTHTLLLKEFFDLTANGEVVPAEVWTYYALVDTHVCTKYVRNGHAGFLGFTFEAMKYLEEQRFIYVSSCFKQSLITMEKVGRNWRSDWKRIADKLIELFRNAPVSTVELDDSSVAQAEESLKKLESMSKHPVHLGAKV